VRWYSSYAKDPRRARQLVDADIERYEAVP
jgi:hypothetical protein